MNVLLGNSSLKPGIRLVSFELSPSLLKIYRGPRFGISGLRKHLNVESRPLLCTALKPMGLANTELAELAYQFANLSLAGLTLVTQFKPPLVSPRLANWWWERLLQALTAGDPGELQVIMEHAGLLTDGLTGPNPNGDES